MSKPSYLSSFEAPKAAEIEHLPNDGKLLFLDIRSVNALRSVQHTIHGESMNHIRDSRGDTLDFNELSIEANAECAEAYDEVARDFLKQFIAEDSEHFDDYLALVREFSIDKIGEEEMALGKIDPSTGERDEETAGYKKLAAIRTKKIEEIDSDTTSDDKEPDKLEIALQKKAEHAIAEGNLDAARKALAEAEVQYRTKKMIGRKKHKKAELEELRAKYREASKTAAIAGFDLIKAEHEAAGKAAPTPKELNMIAQVAFAKEFGKYAAEQNNMAYFTEYGQKARKLGELPLKKKLKRIALVAGIGVLGMATGGIYAAALFGTATALRVKQTMAAGTIGHQTEKGTKRITEKINKKNVLETKAALAVNKTGDTNELADTIANGNEATAMRIHRSNKIRRTIVPVIIAASVAGGVAKSVSSWNQHQDIVDNVRHNLRDTDWNPFRHSKKINEHVPSHGGTGATAVVDHGQSAEQVVTPVTTGSNRIFSDAADYAQYVQNKNLENMGRLFNAHGTYPWSRAVDFFNGDTKAANDWLHMAVSKTPGAQWHNVGDGISTNDWISVNGVSDTDTVWKALTTSMLSK